MAKMVNKSFHSSSKEEKVVLNILIANAKPAVFEPTDKKANNAKIVWANHPSRIHQNNMCICTLCNSPTPEGEIKRWGKCSFCWRKINN